jgi:hypothetical protein
MGSTSGNDDGPGDSDEGELPPAGFVEVGKYDLLVAAGEVIGALADEMEVRCSGRPAWPDMEDVRIWVREADAERARLRLRELAPPPPTPEDFEREETMRPLGDPRGASAIRRFAVLLGAAGLVTIIVRLSCGG